MFEERRARPDWGREMDIPFARAIDRGQVMKIRDLNSGFSSSQTIYCAYYQASLVVEHIVRDLRPAEAARARRSRTPTASTPRRRSRRCSAIDIDELQKSFDAFLDKRYATLRAALKAPEGLKADMPLDQLKAIAAAHPDNFPVQMALGEALRAGESGCGDRGVRERARS